MSKVRTPEGFIFLLMEGDDYEHEREVLEDLELEQAVLPLNYLLGRVTAEEAREKLVIEVDNSLSSLDLRAEMGAEAISETVKKIRDMSMASRLLEVLALRHERNSATPTASEDA